MNVFKNRLVLVTGATSGIGHATAVAFARQGAKVAATGRNEEKLMSLEKDITAEGLSLKSFVGDVTNDEQVKSIVENAVKFSENGKIDVLVNCAGVLQGGATDVASMENWDYNMNSNARSVFCMMQSAIKYLRRDETTKDFDTAAIVNISSVNGLQSFGGVAAYCASKAAVDMLTDCAAVDLAPQKIRVNAINPGVIVTDLQKRGGLGDEQYQQFLERSESVTHPLGRVGQAEEVAESVLFLADPKRAGFITGTHLTIDGGRRCLGAR